MATEVIMPKLGMSMVEGTVVKWLKSVGDSVAKGEALVEISTEKTTTQIAAGADGVLLNIQVHEDETVPYGTAIGHIGQPGEAFATPEPVRPETAPPALSAPSPQLPMKPAEDTVSRSGGRIVATPVAKKMARESGLDLGSLIGTGPGRRITKRDVQTALESHRQQAVCSPAGTCAEESVERIPVAGMRKAIAARMTESLQQSAQLTLHAKADVTELAALHKQAVPHVQDQHGIKLTLTDFIAKAVVLALQAHKGMNSAYRDGCIEVYGHVHLAVAVAVENGLVVPVMRHVHQASVVDLSRGIKSLSQRAKANQLSPDEMSGSTFTLTNLGAFGIEYFTPVLNPPEAGILGIGTAKDEPVYMGDDLQRRTMLPLSLTFDHRVLDGVPAAQFLNAVKGNLEKPLSLLF
ncbi:dihydrolipoamide acetyltransferase family protein [Paenibacillus hodogayensis]|uniref:Dihydrolipoamide acetyltransferase component of pyruvate dehydrogenase complex n=1 Tax=Paenibacillus hodogayensis TaxID=279208 RepID=A0ABV5W040_9BACL